jgi:hypothetical protein
MRKASLLSATTLAVSLVMHACSAPPQPTIQTFSIDADTAGLIEQVNNIYNTVIVSNDANVYKAEYEAGFIEGKLQREMLPATRDNGWDVAYLTDPSHSYPRQLPPSADELALAERTLQDNWEYSMSYIQQQADSDIGTKLRRLMYRLVGVYHGATRDEPEQIAHDDAWFPSFSSEELTLGYETPSLTFLDLYFINAVADLFYVLPSNPPSPEPTDRPSHCTAFVKILPDGDIVLAHNSWYGFLAQSQVMTLWVNGDFMTFNALTPGVISSFTDFGYTNKGLMFNETTDDDSFDRPQTDSLWSVWRASLAEQFATSIDEFFEYVTLELSGTYMNSYQVVDTKTRQIGLIDMSYRTAILFKSDGQGGIEVTTRPADRSAAYDTQLVQPDYLLGINYPASQQVIDDAKPVENRPSRRVQLTELIRTVTDIESTKNLITYTDPTNPLSIYGRWDLGYGETLYPKTVPDGSMDAKAIAASMTNWVSDLEGVLDTSSTNKAFWMKFGTAHIDGKPFIWSQSQWRGQKLRYVPDVLDGEWTLVNAYIR